MANIYRGFLDLIGNTPLVEVANLEKAYNLKAKVLVKLEYRNPAGSVKDRIAQAMIEDAEKKGDPQFLVVHIFHRQLHGCQTSTHRQSKDPLVSSFVSPAKQDQHTHSQHTLSIP